MKLKNLLGAALVLPAMIGAGCSAADENLTCGCDNELTFRATVAEGAARAIGTAWSKGDAVGLFMVNGGSGLATGNLVNNVANYKYVTVEGDGNFEAQSISHLAYYPADGSAVDFVAYYPYQSNLSGFNYAVNVTDQSNPEAIDLLYSNDAKGMSHDSNASMMFHHKLTRMVLTIKEMNGSNLVEGVQVSLNGMHTQGTFALADATLALTSGSKADVAAKMYAQTSGAAQAELIMLPEVAEAGASLTFTHPTAGTFVHAFQVGEEFKTGTQVNIEVILSGSGSDNKVVVLSSNITPWEEVDGGKIDVDFGGTTDEATLAVNPSAVSFEAAGGTKTVAVTVTNQGNNAISISSLSGILSATLSGNTITVTAAENTTTSAVSQSLTVSLTNGASVVVPVTVAGKGNENPVLQTIFAESFGTLEASSTASYVGNYAGYDNSSLTFSNSNTSTDAKANIRSTKTFDNHLWLPANVDNSLKIAGINTAGATNLVLTYDIVPNLYAAADAANVADIVVTWNGTQLTVPSHVMSKANGDGTEYYTVTISTGMTAAADATLEFYGSASVNKLGFRIDNLKLVGEK